MAQSKKPRRKRTAKPKRPDDEPINGVLIRLDPGEKPGERNLTAAPLGDVKETELPALLGIARRAAEEKLGMGGG